MQRAINIFNGQTISISVVRVAVDSDRVVDTGIVIQRKVMPGKTVSYKGQSYHVLSRRYPVFEYCLDLNEVLTQRRNR